MVRVRVAWLCSSVMMVRENVQLATPHSIEALPGLIGTAHHSKMEAIRSIVRACALATRLLPYTLSKQSDSCTHRLVLIVLTHDCKLASIGLVTILASLTFVLHAVYLVVNGVFYSSKAESSIQNGSAVLLVSLAETWILMQLVEDFVESWNRMITLQVFQFLLNRSACKLIILALL